MIMKLHVMMYVGLISVLSFL